MVVQALEEVVASQQPTTRPFSTTEILLGPSQQCLHALAERVLRRQVRTSFCIARAPGNRRGWTSSARPPLRGWRRSRRRRRSRSTSGCRTGQQSRRGTPCPDQWTRQCESPARSLCARPGWPQDPTPVHGKGGQEVKEDQKPVDDNQSLDEAAAGRMSAARGGQWPLSHKPAQSPAAITTFTKGLPERRPVPARAFPACAPTCDAADRQQGNIAVAMP